MRPVAQRLGMGKQITDTLIPFWKVLIKSLLKFESKMLRLIDHIHLTYKKYLIFKRNQFFPFFHKLYSVCPDLSKRFPAFHDKV